MNTFINLRLCSKSTLLLIAFFSFNAAIYAAPTITLVGNATINHQVYTPYTDPGATAVDDNGDPLSVGVDYSRVNTNAIAMYQVEFTATDANNVTTKVTRTVIVTDLIKPTINGLNYVRVQRNDFGFTEPPVNATDNYFPNINLTRNGTYDVTTVGLYYITYTAIDGAGNTESWVRTIEVVDGTTGITGINSEKGIAAYPNPGNGKFTVEILSPVTENTQIKIIAINGQQIQAIPASAFSNGKTTIDLTGIEAGVYFVQVNNNQKLSVVKLVVNK